MFHLALRVNTDTVIPTSIFRLSSRSAQVRWVMMGPMRRLLALLIIPLLLIAACSDAGSALSRAHSTGVLNVGVVDNPPQTIPGEGGDVTGPDAELIGAYTESIGAHPSWQVGDIDALTAAVDRGEIDVIIGANGPVEGLTGPASGSTTVLVGAEEPQLKDSINVWLPKGGEAVR